MATITTDVLSANDAATRAADTLLRIAGGRQVLLRTPLPGTPGDPAEQLGLATPAFQDVALAPVVFRKSRASATTGKAIQWELLVSASAVEAIVGSLAFQSASVLFAKALGILVDDTLMSIQSVTSSQIFGVPYVYRLIVQQPFVLLT